MDLSIPSLGNKFLDLRGSLVGDSFKWSWERPLSDIKYLAIHHSATEPFATPQEIAKLHVEKNGWGGIGYHFLIDQKGIVFYVGDISTARANVANMNEQVVGVCLIGNFTNGKTPTVIQLQSLKKLIEFFINFEGISIDGLENVKAHRDLPGQATMCPGDTWLAWRQTLQLQTPGVKYIQTSGLLKKNSDILESQVDNLQTSLATLEQQKISLQESLADREKQLTALALNSVKADDTLTIIEGLVKLYKFFFLPREAAA